jgi:hypothetical protein
MAIVQSVQVQNSLVVTELLENEAVEGQPVIVKEFEPGMQNLTSTTSPPVSMQYAEELTFDGSSSAEDTQTIDLSAFDDLEGVEQDAEGLRVQVLRVITPSTNIEEVTIGPAAADGYEMFGPGNEIDIPPGSNVMFIWDDELDEVFGDSAALLTDIDVTGNGGDSVQIQIILG